MTTTTFYVPIENRSLPAGNLSRWHILVVEATSVEAAMEHAENYVATLPRTVFTGASGRAVRARHALWAAVRDIPSFAYMQSLRDNFDALRSVRLRHKRSDRRIPGYV